MKAAIYTQYGPPDVVEIREVEEPAPNEDEVLIEVRAGVPIRAGWRCRRGRRR